MCDRCTDAPKETRTITRLSMEDYFHHMTSIGKCPLCDGPWPHDETGCPTFQEAED